jgi:hypothetical protein
LIGIIEYWVIGIIFIVLMDLGITIIGIVLNIGQIGHLITHFTLTIIVGIGHIGGGIILGGMDIIIGITDPSTILDIM